MLLYVAQISGSYFARLSDQLWRYRQDFLMSENKNGKQVNAANSKKEKTANAVAKNKKTDLKVADAKKNEVKKVEPKKNAKAVPSGNPFDKLLWLLSFALLAAAVGGNYYYTQFIMIDESSLARLGRVAIVIVTILAGLAVVLFTNKGKKLLAFGRDSYTELRKVVWPARNEAMQTTAIVFVAVVLVSLFLYVCDLAFLQIVRLITL